MSARLNGSGIPCAFTVDSRLGSNDKVEVGFVVKIEPQISRVTE